MTVRQKEVLEYIIEFKKTNGYSPTVKEIMRGVNTNSVNYVTETLNRLRDEKYITFKDKAPRTINVIRFPKDN